jgi:hypothetical protein
VCDTTISALRGPRTSTHHTALMADDRDFDSRMAEPGVWRARVDAEAHFMAQEDNRRRRASALSRLPDSPAVTPPRISPADSATPDALSLQPSASPMLRPPPPSRASTGGTVYTPAPTPMPMPSPAPYGSPIQYVTDPLAWKASVAWVSPPSPARLSRMYGVSYEPRELW